MDAVKTSMEKFYGFEPKPKQLNKIQSLCDEIQTDVLQNVVPMYLELANLNPANTKSPKKVLLPSPLTSC